ncbi:hypothetical protein ES707_02336 [subsurface metagenome]
MKKWKIIKEASELGKKLFDFLLLIISFGTILSLMLFALVMNWMVQYMFPVFILIFLTILLLFLAFIGYLKYVRGIEFKKW